MKRARIAVVVVVVVVVVVLSLAACDRKQNSAGSAPPSGGSSSPAEVNRAATSLADERQSFQTQLTRQINDGTPVSKPPPELFTIVHYSSASGSLGAYLTPDPRDGKRHPAIIWITGGDCNTIGDVWSPAAPDNDQTAAAYRRAGICMMFPSLRGGNDNPGHEEKFYGEVDDVLAAAEFLAGQSFIDPNRIYLGGHSTGGTLALLVAECPNKFRAIFSFGPVDDIRRYAAGTVAIPFNTDLT